MQIKIQNFTLFLFILLALAVSLLWSFSLYQTHSALSAEKVRLYRDDWQIHLDQVQKSQHLWLQQRYKEVAEWMGQNEGSDQRLAFISQYYLTYPQLRAINIYNNEAVSSTQPAAIVECQKLPADPAGYDAEKANIPEVQTCLFMLKPMLGISAEIATQKSHKLVLLMDYFSFIGEFEKLTGKHFYRDNNAQVVYGFMDSQENESALKVEFQFDSNGSYLGSLSVTIPGESFFTTWFKQAIWVVPSIFLCTMLFYLALYRALIQPLLLITQRLNKVVLTKRPGNAYDPKFLTPGLQLLHKYFMHLSYLTKRDHLTGLNNRAIFEERLQQSIRIGKRSGRKYALVLADVNDFIKVNRQYGRYLGDGLLKKLASRLSDLIRESDGLARLEDDNFAVLLEFDDEDLLTTLVEKIYQTLSGPYLVYGRKISIGVSIGVAIYPEHAQKMEGLMLKANEALMKAHKSDWPVVFSEQAKDQLAYFGLSLIQSLRQALENNDFKLVYQPVMDLRNHKTSYFEALLRWKQPELHPQSIEQTIALAEKNQLIKPLSLWIIETACKQLKKLGENPVKIAVNLSMIDFHDENLPDRIGQILQKYGVKPQKLMLEITEGQIMKDPDQVINILTLISEMGISLSIDDFGTGQASLTYLKKLPVEKLKIDQSFVKELVVDQEDSAIVQATINLAHTLNIEVVAEGVESADILEVLKNMDCDYVQGYYISYPVDKQQVANWIESNQVLSNA